VGEYIGTGLRRGEAAVLIVGPAHRMVFLRELEAKGCYAEQAVQNGQLKLLDAQETLNAFMSDGMPEWNSFHAVVGGVIAQLRLQYPTVRAYGEMVDVLWQAGERAAAIRLEELWNELAKLQTFSLLCAYYMDHLDTDAYGGALECVCKVHTHLIPVRDYAGFNQAVTEASKDVLDQPLAQMLMSLSATHRPPTQMPLGQATLLWLNRNMPRTAQKILTGVRAKRAA
jgi:hypothetical protein